MNKYMLCSLNSLQFDDDMIWLSFDLLHRNLMKGNQSISDI